MFVLKKDNVVWWPAILNQPVDDGEVVPHKISLKINIVSPEKYNELAIQGDGVLFEEVVQGWRDVNTPKGSALPFTKDNKAAFFNVPFVAAGIVACYHEAASGKAAIKN